MSPSIEIDGTCDHRFREVRDAFAENLDKRGEVGASVAVVVEGRPVVDLWGGFAEPSRKKAWERDTIVNVYSATKGVAALCAHRLVEQELLDLARPVADYWPEFAEAGKEDLPVHYLLSHRAGLPAVKAPLAIGAWADWDLMAAALARTEPWWEPGTKHGYHALTFGWLVGEVVKRVSGKSLGTFFHDEVAEPLGLDFHVGLSEEHYDRVASIVAMPPPQGQEEGEAPQLSVDKESMAYKAMSNPEDMMLPATANTRAWRGAEVPAANGHANARALARFYAALAVGGVLDKRYVLGRDFIEAAVVEQACGPDAVLGDLRRFALGFMLPTERLYLGPTMKAFGHSGAGGALGFADPEAAVGFGYAMNQMQQRGDEGDPRWRPLIDAMFEAL